MVVPLADWRNWDQTGRTESLQSPSERHLRVLLLPLVVESVSGQRERRQRDELRGTAGVDGDAAASVPS